MATEHPNASLLREAMEAMDEGQPERFLELLADDVEWYEVGADEPLRGKQAVFDAFQGGDFEIEAEVHDILATDDHVVFLVEATGKRAGETFEYRTVEIVHVEDGKITERWSFADDTQAVREFFG